MPTWDSAAADDLWTKACGKDRWLGTAENLERDIRRVSDDSLWQFRLATSKSLVEYAASAWPGTMPPPARHPKRLRRRNISLTPML